MRRDSVLGTFTVATVLCIVCSVLVSAAAVGLRPQQEANKARFQKKNILDAAGISTEGTTIDKAFSVVETKLIDLETGEVVEDQTIIEAASDQRTASKDPELSVEIDPDDDIAGIKRREKYSNVYLVSKDGKLSKVVLPVYGKGLWSTLYGFIALESDLNTVAGLTFYDHAETPGLGGEVDNPSWKAKWPGKLIRGEEGNVQIEVVKGSVPEGADDAIHKVDGLSGATITSRGVSNLIRYWLSDKAFGSYLERLKAGGPSDG